MKTKTACLLFGILFLLVGLLGFIPNPIVGPSDAVFHADTLHSMVHIVSGILFLLFGLAIPGGASAFMLIFGIVYLLLGVLGMMQIGDQGMTSLLGFLHVNGADNYLHIGLGLAILLANFLKPKSPAVVA